MTRFMTGALLLIALGAFLLRPGGAANWLFLLFLFGVGHLTMMTSGFIEHTWALYLIIYSLLALTPGVGLLLLTVFPRTLEISALVRGGIVVVSLLFAASHPLRLALLGIDSPSLAFELATRANPLAIDRYAIAMEFVDGPPLRALIAAARKRQEQVPLGVWLQLAQSLLGALEHAHTVKDAQGKPMGVVHRDVTPANVLVAKTGEAKLVDFGLVLANTRLFRTQTGIARGTLPYMSPEQGAGELVDLRADLYSAAASLYELLTLARAFPEGPYTGPRPEKASVVRPELPAELDEVFERGFAAAREARPASAAEFSAQLTLAAGVSAANEAEVSAWVQALMVEVGELKPRSEESTRSVQVASS